MHDLQLEVTGLDEPHVTEQDDLRTRTKKMMKDKRHVCRQRLKRALATEIQRFRDEHPASLQLFEDAKRHLINGVPMHWMVRWPGDFPVFVQSGAGAHFRDVDGREYIDFCLGDTGAMAGHAPAPSVQAVANQVSKGVTFMLPTSDSVWVSRELSRRFGLPYWQFALTATDANRFVLRLARHMTGRKIVLVFNWCYHGSVDEAFATITDSGRTGPRAGNIGFAVDPSVTTRVIEFNDVQALEEALRPGDVACVLAEPAMTNIGIVQPKPGYHDALRRLTAKYGTLLIIDETHTCCCGEGGYTREHGLKPDMLTIGKPIAGGVPAAAYGFSEEVAARVRTLDKDLIDTGGIGGTLAGNALSMAAMRATLEHVLTPAAFTHTISLAEQWTEGVKNIIERYGLPWHVDRLGCRAEYWFCPDPPTNGREAAATIDADLDRYMHLAMLNRGILMTPFHNMVLIAPQTTERDIEYHTRVFQEIVDAVTVKSAAL